MSKYLTPRQSDVLESVKRYWAEHGEAPSATDIAKLVNISRQNALQVLHILQQKGVITRDDTYRSWRPVLTKEPPVRPRAKSVSSSTTSWLKPKKTLQSIPLIGRVAAGAPLLAVENVEGELWIQHDNAHDVLFALRVCGTSMIKAGIFDGDVVVIRQQATFHNGDIVLALIGDEATIKRFKRTDTQICLIPENDAMQPVYYDPDDVIFQGKLIEIRRSLE